jgi:hypothetical protein
MYQATGDRIKARNIHGTTGHRQAQLKETYRQVTEEKKHAATGDLQTGGRRQETCSYRRPTDRRQKTRNFEQETYRQETEDKKHAATGDLQAGDRRQETCLYRRLTGR